MVGEPHLRFLDALAAKDWERLAEVTAEDMEWHGPQGDRLHRGRDYADRLRGSIGRLQDYRIEVVRAAGDAPVMVELVQSFAVPEGRRVVPEVMVFDVDPSTRRITRLAVYVRGADKE